MSRKKRFSLPYRKIGFTYAIKIVSLFLVYFLSARFGLSLDAVSNFATLVWVPSGISLAALLLFGYRLWPGIALGAFVVNFAHGAPFPVATTIAIGNTLEAVVCVYLLRRFGFRTNLNRMKDIFLFLALSPLGAFVSATIGVSSIYIARLMPINSYIHTWTSWWMGDMVSIILITPLLLTWKDALIKKITLKKFIESLILIIMLFLVGIGIFHFPLQLTTYSSPITYLVFLPLIWAAIRFGQRGTTATIFVLSGLAIAGTITGLGPFVDVRLSQSLFLLQSFMGTIAITTLILASVVAERKDLEIRKDAFIGMASHELKTPITSLKAYVQLLQKQTTKNAHIEYTSSLKKINTQIDRLTKLINELLNLSQMQSGKLEYHDESFDINKLTQEVIESMQTANKKYAIQVEGKIKKKIYGDRDHLGQVLINLITNAMKYSKNEHTVIVRLASSTNIAQISVQDFGIGMNKAHLDKIFDKFYQVSEKRQPASSGLGIGLYIANEIIKRHGGKILVESAKDKGSTFTVTLPLHTISTRKNKVF